MHSYVRLWDWPFVLFGTPTSISSFCLTHLQPEGTVCHLSGWRNDSKSSNSKSLATLLDLPSLANMDLCLEAGGVCYKSINNTKECVHIKFCKAWKHKPLPTSLTHTCTHRHTTIPEIIINVVLTRLWQGLSSSCACHRCITSASCSLLSSTLC